jgi:hypothetical protein
MSSLTPLEKENTILAIVQNTIAQHGYTLEKVAGSNQFKAKHAEWKAKDKYFWLDEDCQVCCEARYADGLREAGLNPAVCLLPAVTPNAINSQVGGDHYKNMKIQPWHVMRAVMTREEYTAYQIGTVLAYLMRHKAKGGEQDIKKAHHHLTELVEYLNETPKI